MFAIGIDIGSSSAKTIVMDEQRQILERFVIPTGWSSIETAEAIRAYLSTRGIELASSVIVATGYGRVSVPFANKTLTEISCHGLGAAEIYNLSNSIIIDIGGQDTKIIMLRESKVKDFVMNDKCSAGTGRFIEIMANTLGVGPYELTELASSGSGTSISSMCTVFAESEVIGLIGRGEKRENIAFAVVDSVVKKVAAQAGRIDLGTEAIGLTGGLCESEYLIKALSLALKREVISRPDGRFAGAIGAALYARQLVNRN